MPWEEDDGGLAWNKKEPLKEKFQKTKKLQQVKCFYQDLQFQTRHTQKIRITLPRKGQSKVGLRRDCLWFFDIYWKFGLVSHFAYLKSVFFGRGCRYRKQAGPRVTQFSYVFRVKPTPRTPPRVSSSSLTVATLPSFPL